MADVIDFKLHKSTMDLVEITLDPGEAVVIETGSMVSMDHNIQMSAIVGDGSKAEKGLFGKMIGAGKRMVTGEGVFMTKLENTGTGRGNVLLSPGGSGSKVIPVDLSRKEAAFLCNKGHFLAAARGVNVGMGVRFKPFANLVGSAEMVTQRLDGEGYAFLKANGTSYTRYLREGEKIKIDENALVGMHETVKYGITVVKGIRSMMFSGEGLILYELEGPGVVILQGHNELDVLKERLEQFENQNNNKKK